MPKENHVSFTTRMKESQQLSDFIFELEEKRKRIHRKQVRLVPLLMLAPFVAAVAGAFMYEPVVGVIFGILGIVGSIVAGVTEIASPWKKVKNSFKSSVLADFMTRYHPDIEYDYSPKRKRVKSIVKDSKLVTASSFFEHDVIQGRYRSSDFYLSEIHLKQSSGKSSHTVFKGILFNFTVPGKNFPKSRIQTKANLLKRWFSGFVRDPEYGFWYESEDMHEFLDEMRSLFPFIRHLMDHQGDVRLKAEGNEITLLLESDMKFLDDPKPKLKKPFDDQTYFKNIGQQVNSLLYILDAMVDDLDTTEIEDRLELSLLEELPQRVKLDSIPGDSSYEDMDLV